MGGVFDYSDNGEGVYASAYTLSGKLNSETAIPENFTIKIAGESIPTGDIFYYPATNQLMICTAENSGIIRKKATVRATNLSDINGNDASFEAEGVFTRLLDVKYGEVGVSKISYYKNGEPVANIIDKENIDVLVRVCNATRYNKNNILVKVYDGEKFIGSKTVSVDAGNYVEVKIETGSHRFAHNDVCVRID